MKRSLWSSIHLLVLTLLFTAFVVAQNNPVPTTSDLSPTSKMLGDDAFTLTVNGGGFFSGSVVRFNGSDRTTSLVNDGRVEASILTTDLDSAGTFSITVFNPLPGGGESNSQTFTVNNPLPSTSNINPTNVFVGGSAFTITVNGTGFVPSSVVLFDDSSRTTTFVSTTELTANILATDLDTAGTFDVTVLTPGPGGGTSNAQVFTVIALNPLPTTTSTTPATKNVGDAAFPLTVNGTNFVAGSVARFNGSDRITTFVSATEVTASILASDLTTAGTFSVTVFNPLPGGGESNAQTFTVNNVLPITTSLSHTSKTVGDDAFTINVNGFSFVSGSVVRFNGVDRTTVFVNDTRVSADILVTDLDTAGTFSITVFNPAPGGGISNAQTFTVNNPLPSTSGITPAVKAVGDTGFTMTVNGTGFLASSVVRYDGSDRATTFVNATQLTATILTSDLDTAGTFNITVFNPTPGGGTSNAQTFTVNAVNPTPTTTGITPATKILNDPEFTLTVNGTDFVSGAIVRFNGSDRTTSFVSPTTVTATIPATDLDTVGTYSITVLNPAPGGGVSNVQTLAVNNPLPVTSGISPNVKAVGDTGFTLTVNGSGFLAQSIVRLNDSARTTTFVSGTQLTAAILTTDLDTAGSFSITVVNQSPGGGTSNTQTLTVSPANPVPTTVSLSPVTKNVGDAAFPLTVNGTNFVAGSVARFNGSDRITTFVSATEVTASILASDLTTAGTFSVTVFNPLPGGGESNAQTFTVNNVLPITTSLSHTSKTVGDDAFTINVNGFSFVSGSVVRFNGVDRTTVFVNDTRVSADILVTDLDTAGTFSITVFNPAPGGGISNAQTFTVNNPLPSTSGITPAVKAVGDTGFTMTVNGTGFLASSVVRYDGSDRATTFVNATQLTATILTSDLDTAGTFNITVFNPTPGGGTSNAQTFTVSLANPLPTTVSISPTSKFVIDASFELTVTGTNFVAGSVVRLGGLDRTTTFVTATELTASILASDLDTATTFDITVFNPLPGGGVSNAQTFTVNNRLPTTTTLSNPSKNVGDDGFGMNVNGTNFVAGSVARFNGSDRVTSFTNDTRVFVQILTSDLDSAGTFNITVFNSPPGGGESNATTFTVNNPLPSTSGITPAVKAVGDAGFTMTVNGTGFLASSLVQYNGSDRATAFVNSTQLTATILTSDVDTAGTFNITVINPAPGGGTSNAQTFTVSLANPVPATVSITPATKSVGDTAFTLTVNGTSFVATSIVHLNGSSRPTTFVNDTQLTASIHAGDMALAGVFDITVFNPLPGGGESNPQVFTVNNVEPILTTLSHTSKMVGDSGFTMEVNGWNLVSTSVVRFNGSNRTTAFLSDTRVTGLITAADLSSAGVYPITVFNPAPGGGVSNTLSFTVNNHIPTETSISPTSKTVGDAGFTLTVTGTKFIPGSVARFAGSSRTTTFVDSTQITVAILATDLDTIGAFPITVVNPAPGGGESNPQTFTVNATNPVPTTVSIVPANKNVGDATFGMAITGTNFVSTSIVRINGSSRTTTFVDTTQLTATILATDMDTAGTFDITVFNPLPGGGISNAQVFTVNLSNPVPVISSLSPSTKAVGDPALSLSVIGLNFVAGSVVRIDGSARTTIFVDSTHLTADLIASDLDTAGTFNISVFNPAPGGGISNSQTLTVTPPNPVPGLNSIAPTSKYVGDAGITLDISGYSFAIGVVARFNGSDRPTLRVNEDHLDMTLFDTDFDTSGTFLITVFNPAPGGGLSDAETLTVNKAGSGTAVVSSLNPSNAGQSVTFTATITPSLASGSVQFFDGVISLGAAPLSGGSGQISTSALTVGDHLITAAYSGDTNYVGSSSPGITQTVNPVNPVPTTSYVNFPNKNVGDAPFSMFVNGTGFLPTSVIRFDSVDRVTTFVNDTRLQTDVPDSDLTYAHTISITVFNPAPGGGESDSVTFVVNNLVPGILTLTPSSKTAGDAGFTLSLKGTNFVQGSIVRFNGSNRTTTFVEADSITATIPASDLNAAGLFDITVFNPAPGGGVSSPRTFTVNLPTSTFVSVSPSADTVEVPTPVSLDITVTNVTGLKGSTVRVVYDRTIVQYDSATVGTFLPDGFSTNHVAGTTSNYDTVMVDQAVFVGTATGSGLLFTVHFTSLAAGTTPVNLLSVNLRDEFNAAIPATAISGSVTCTPPAYITVNTKIFLEGAYNTGTSLMNTALSADLPLAHPYGGAPWSYTGVDSVVSGFFALHPTNVDWVLIELRTGTGAGTKIATRAALVQNTGAVVDTDGTSPVRFSSVGAGNYYIVIRHRNQLAVMSAAPVALSASSGVYDFTTAQSQGYSTNPGVLDPMTGLGIGGSAPFGMIAGDTDGSGVVDASDRSATWNLRNQSGYRAEDVDLSGVVDASDRSITWNGRNRSTLVP